MVAVALNAHVVHPVPADFVAAQLAALLGSQSLLPASDSEEEQSRDHAPER